MPNPSLRVSVTVYNPGVVYACQTLGVLTSGEPSPKSHVYSTRPFQLGLLSSIGTSIPTNCASPSLLPLELKRSQVPGATKTSPESVNVCLQLNWLSSSLGASIGPPVAGSLAS